MLITPSAFYLSFAIATTFVFSSASGETVLRIADRIIKVIDNTILLFGVLIAITVTQFSTVFTPCAFLGSAFALYTFGCACGFVCTATIGIQSMLLWWLTNFAEC